MSETAPQPGSAAWHAQVEEPVIAPEQPLIDPHHHFWLPEHDSAWGSYELDDLWADTGSGHRVVKTVFIECHAHYRTTGPEHLRPVGETEWVAGIAGESAAGAPGQAVVGGIVSHADLRLGERLGEVLDAHEEAGGGLFRGIRHAGARHPQPEASYGTPARGHRRACSWTVPSRRECDCSAGAATPTKAGTTTTSSTTIGSWHWRRPIPP